MPRLSNGDIYNHVVSFHITILEYKMYTLFINRYSKTNKITPPFLQPSYKLLPCPINMTYTPHISESDNLIWNKGVHKNKIII